MTAQKNTQKEKKRKEKKRKEKKRKEKKKSAIVETSKKDYWSHNTPNSTLAHARWI